jgi:hypothetical protein
VSDLGHPRGCAPPSPPIIVNDNQIVKNNKCQKRRRCQKIKTWSEMNNMPIIINMFTTLIAVPSPRRRQWRPTEQGEDPRAVAVLPKTASSLSGVGVPMFC